MRGGPGEQKPKNYRMPPFAGGPKTAHTGDTFRVNWDKSDPWGRCMSRATYSFEVGERVTFNSMEDVWDFLDNCCVSIVGLVRNK
jgi:hypothetical protein